MDWQIWLWQFFLLVFSTSSSSSESAHETSNHPRKYRHSDRPKKVDEKFVFPFCYHLCVLAQILLPFSFQSKEKDRGKSHRHKRHKHKVKEVGHCLAVASCYLLHKSLIDSIGCRLWDKLLTCLHEWPLAQNIFDIFLLYVQWEAWFTYGSVWCIQMLLSILSKNWLLIFVNINCCVNLILFWTHAQRNVS